MAKLLIETGDGFLLTEAGDTLVTEDHVPCEINLSAASVATAGITDGSVATATAATVSLATASATSVTLGGNT